MRGTRSISGMDDLGRRIDRGLFPEDSDPDYRRCRTCKGLCFDRDGLLCGTCGGQGTIYHRGQRTLAAPLSE